LIPTAVLRKYVAFARRYCAPSLSPEAALVLRDFYEGLRRAHGSTTDGMPITTRQLESLVRLSQARARLELRDLVTRADALEVTALLRDALWDAASDGLGGQDWGRGAGGAGMSLNKKVLALVSLLKKDAARGAKSWGKDAMQAMASSLTAVGSGVTSRDLLDRAHEQGFLTYASGIGYRLAV